MSRSTLPSDRLHPSIRARVAGLHVEVVREVEAALAAHPVVVVGMAANPFVLRARRALRTAGIEHHYLGYGGYLLQWRRRNALKMRSGWPTFPMVFVRGLQIGGAEDLQRLIAAGELDGLLHGDPARKA